LLSKTNGILVLGSSLETYSCFRYIDEGVKQNKQIGIINIGRTRADNVASIKFELRIGEFLENYVKSMRI